MNIHTATMRMPGAVHFGLGARRMVPRAVRSLGNRALVVVDPAVARLPLFGELIDAFVAGGVSHFVYSRVVPELPLDSVRSAVDSTRPVDPQVIVAVGGGTALDLAKILALLLTNPGDLSDYYGENKVSGPVLPIVAVPTTAGTGSEVSPVAVVSDPSREIKVGISDAALIPTVAVVDPEFAVELPARPTAESGIDAMVHAVESLTSSAQPQTWSGEIPVFGGRNPMSSLVALEGIRELGYWLPRAVSQGRDVEARVHCAYGSLLAGMAFSASGTHLCHALQYPIGALTGTSHGRGTGLLLPFMMRAILPVCQTELAEIGQALGVGSDPVAAITRVESIVDQIGIPKSLAEIGISDVQLVDIAERGLRAERLVRNSPVPATRDFLLGILQSALHADGSHERADDFSPAN